MSMQNEKREMTENQIDTIIIAAYASKQQVTITLHGGEKYTGFIYSDFDVDGFSLTTSYIWWKDIQFVQPNNEFFNERSDILERISDPFTYRKVDD